MQRDKTGSEALASGDGRNSSSFALRYFRWYKGIHWTGCLATQTTLQAFPFSKDTMVAFICSFLLILILTTSSVAGEPANIQNPQVHFACGPADNAASGILVFIREWGNEYKWRAHRTDENGCLFESVTMAAKEPGKSAGRFYLMLPHNPDRWSLLKATNTAVPSAETIFNGPDDRKRSELLKKLGHQVGSTWHKVDGKLCLKADQAPQPGLIRMHTQSMSGEPLRKHSVQLIARDLGHGYSSRDTVIWSGTTDENGRIQIRQFPGICNWVVVFPALGHTQTGPIVVDPGSVTDLELNRPIRYATISGRIDDELLSSVSAETRVYLGTEHAWRYRQADVDSNGGFKITEVPIGASYNLKLTGISTEHVSVRGLLPGEHRTGVEIAPPGQRAAELAEANKQLQSQQAASKGRRPKLRGRVVDLNGNAMPGVIVYATMKFHGGIRMYQVTKNATTDAEGFYEIDEADFKFGSVALMACVPGRPPAFGAGGYFGATEDTSVIVGIGGAMIGSEPSEQLPDVLRQPDLVIPDPEQSGVLKVCCLKDGIPRDGVEVRLELIDFHSSFSPGWAAGRTPEALNRVLTPIATTDSNGEVLFGDLSPGCYRVTATLPKPKAAKESPYDNRWSSQGVTVADHVAVTSGDSNSISLFVDDTDETNVPFKVQHTDGTWLTNTSVSTSWLSPASGHGRSSGSKIDDNGLGEICPRQTGMWSLSVKYLTPALGSRTTPLRSQPSYAGERQVAISRLIPRHAPLQFAAERVRPATIVATVEDEDGQRIAAAVSLDEGSYNNGFMGHETRFASTDSRGSVSFTRVQAGTHKLRAMIPGLSAATARLDAPDSDFANEFAVPAAVIDVASGEKQTVELRTCQVAYIRGKITPVPPQDAVLNFGLEDNWTLHPFETSCLRSSESGEFIVGPILPGKHTVGIRVYEGNQEVASMLHEFDVKSAGIHRENIPYKPTPTIDIRAAVSEISGVVLRPDGQTPAYAARVAFYAPGSAVSRAGAWSDATGGFKLHAQSYRMNYAGEVTNPDGSPPNAAIVAWLPGELGAAVLALPTEVSNTEPTDLKLILPERASIQGVVTIEGQATRGLPATITVLARHRGLGKLDPVLSVLATANTDGSYEVRGLTPGSYELQAAIDGIWLSRPRALVVPDSRVWTTKVDFDFRPIGDTAKYLLVDDSGNPVPNRAVRLLGPEFSGPLAKALRTDELRTDTRGLLYLEGLAAGNHRLLVDGSELAVTIAVPSLGSPMKASKQLRIAD